ncbi:hypothetical protein K491DRAFT_294716 [Lophiostoma macrostomum CBS 122681]|uniref:Uncharacterized protein n=1 Tax=Lophiostoma macrostomum CBS 122681 TaxID=1314788 RepID=A0A6A6TEE7_9PLEO|nr:hypothetical protein K491DRAFT_294716 [Lophiostoma macrostomum CBS 122681]
MDCAHKRPLFLAVGFPTPPRTLGSWLCNSRTPRADELGTDPGGGAGIMFAGKLGIELQDIKPVPVLQSDSNSQETAQALWWPVFVLDEILSLNQSLTIAVDCGQRAVEVLRGPGG